MKQRFDEPTNLAKGFHVFGLLQGIDRSLIPYLTQVKLLTVRNSNFVFEYDIQNKSFSRTIELRKCRSNFYSLLKFYLTGFYEDTGLSTNALVSL